LLPACRQAGSAFEISELITFTIARKKPLFTFDHGRKNQSEGPGGLQ
jgi:hypothetical protein